MVFSRARSERNVEDCAGLACWMIIDLVLKRFANGRVGRQYFSDISWGGPKPNGLNPSEDFYANLARHLSAAVINT